MTQRLAIQTLLIELARAGKFYEVKYNSETGLPEDIDVRTAQTVEPGTALCNETGALFEPDERQGRRLARKRSIWTFSLILTFKAEVTLEIFEESLCDPVPVPAENPDSGQPAQFVHLLSTQVVHPAQQGATVGTQATLTFEVVASRR